MNRFSTKQSVLLESKGRTYARYKHQFREVPASGIQTGTTTYHAIHEPLQLVPDGDGDLVRDVGDGQDLARCLVPGNDPVVLVENRHVGGRQRGALELGPAATVAGAPAAGRFPGLRDGVAADEHAVELHDVVPPLTVLVGVPGDVVFGGEVEAVLITEAVKTTPLPTTTEVGLRTHNRSQ